MFMSSFLHLTLHLKHVMHTYTHFISVNKEHLHCVSLWRLPAYYSVTWMFVLFPVLHYCRWCVCVRIQGSKCTGNVGAVQVSVHKTLLPPL